MGVPLPRRRQLTVLDQPAVHRVEGDTGARIGPQDRVLNPHILQDVQDALGEGPFRGGSGDGVEVRVADMRRLVGEVPPGEGRVTGMLVG